MLDVFIAEAAAVLAHRQPDIMAPRGLIVAPAAAAAPFSPEGLDWVPTFDTYRHRESCVEIPPGRLCLICVRCDGQCVQK